MSGVRQVPPQHFPVGQANNLPMDSDVQMDEGRHVYLGEKMDFDVIRNNCIAHGGILYEDPEFSAVDASLYFSQPAPYQVEWLRPSASV